MKKVLLILSLTLNALAFCLWLRPDLQAGVESAPAQKSASTPTKTGLYARQKTGDYGKQEAPWQKIESKDYSEFISQLRKIGCPEKTIHHIVGMRAARAAYLSLEKAQDAIYQTNGLHRANTGFATVDKIRQELIEQKEKLLESLFGPTASFDLDMELDPPAQDYSLEFLSADKRRQLAKVDRDYDRLEADLRMANNILGLGMDRDDKQKLAALRPQKRHPQSEPQERSFVPTKHTKHTKI